MTLVLPFARYKMGDALIGSPTTICTSVATPVYIFADGSPLALGSAIEILFRNDRSV